jgi:cell division protein FtsB
MRLRVAIGATMVVLILFAFVFPFRAWLAQQHEVDRVRQHLSMLDAQNRSLQREATLLQTPAEIDRLARSRFHMVRPGEDAYAVVPGTTAPRATTTTTTTTATTAP